MISSGEAVAGRKRSGLVEEKFSHGERMRKQRETSPSAAERLLQGGGGDLNHSQVAAVREMS